MRAGRKRRRVALRTATVTAVALALAGGATAIALQHTQSSSVDVALSSDHARSGFEYGTQFTVASSGKVSSVAFRDSRNRSQDVASLWTSTGKLLGSAQAGAVRSPGWRSATFTTPVTVSPGTQYVVSYWSSDWPHRRTSTQPPKVDAGVSLGTTVVGRGKGFPSHATGSRQRLVVPLATAAPAPAPTPTATPTPSETPEPTPKPTPTTTAPSAPANNDFPNASNTGVPAGTSLTPYTGNCTITKAGTVIEGKTLNCSVLVKAADVVISKSKINGVVDSDSNTSSASVTIADSEVSAGTIERAAVNSHDVLIQRSNIHGGEHSVQCNHNCTIEDSWLHGQSIPADEDWHLNAFISNGGSDMKLVHNTLQCDAKITRNDGGCTADASIFGDFEPNTRFTFDRNLFVASTELSYCAYGGYDPAKSYGSNVSYIVFTNNVFQRGTNGKCGLYGAVTSFNDSKPGMVFKGNVWDDGKPVTP